MENKVLVTKEFLKDVALLLDAYDESMVMYGHNRSLYTIEIVDKIKILINDK